jgi:hypothetical protein
LNAQNGVIPIYDPATTRFESGRNVRDQYPGNRIPASRLDPVGVKLASLLPLANRPADGPTGANNFRANGSTALNRDNITAKLDHRQGDRDTFAARWMYNSDIADRVSVYPEPATDPANKNDFHQQLWFGSWTRILTPTRVNELRFNYGTRFADTYSRSIGGNWPAKLGIKGVPEDAFPQINITGFAGMGSPTQRRLSTPIQHQQFVDNLTWVSGRHSFKFGGEARRSRMTDLMLANISGTFGFNTLATGQPGVAASGNSVASLLLGIPNAFSSRDTPPLDRSSWYLAAFAQDDWSITQRLTLNIGVRWETDTPMVDANNLLNGFDPAALNPVSGTPGVVKFAGVSGWRRKPWDTDWNNFGPRFGFAWKPLGSDKTVLRGGFGIFFGHPFDHAAPNSASLGFERSASLTSPDNGITAPFYLRDGVPVSSTAPKLDDSFGAVPVGRAATTAVSFYETNRRTSYSQQFNLGVQRELPGGTIIEVGYLGNLSRKLPGSNLSINQIRPELMGPAASQKDRPFPQFSNVTLAFPTLGVSNYHAGVVRLERRFSSGFNILSTYTWSKFLNNVDEGGGSVGVEGGSYSDYYNRRADWGPSENDIPHRFTFSSTYELPFGTGRKYLGGTAIGRIVGGWTVGTVILMQSGAPFTVGTQVNTTNAFSAGNLRADVLRTPNLPNDQRTLARWFDTGAFQQPALYRFGNQGMNILRADGRSNANFSLLRNIRLSEGKQFQLRGEFFNAFNHPDFGIPGRQFGAAGFGIVSSSTGGRSVQVGLRFKF